jgi:hypothetical protein
MKNFITMFVIGACSLSSLAGDKIGNGGGLWSCETTLHQMTSAVLVDLFEAEQHDLQVLPVQGMAQSIAVDKIKTLGQANVGLANKLDYNLNDVFSKIRFVNAVLEKVDDALYIMEPLPATCPLGEWHYLQFANYTNQNQVLIRKDVWTSAVVSELDKAALLVHEAVYRWLRSDYADTNSVRSRRIVGLLFSNLAVEQINKGILELIGPVNEPGILDNWACLLKNHHTNISFIGYGQLKQESTDNVMKSCQSVENGFFCNEQEADCEEAQTNASVWYCSVKNSHLHTNFSGKGRTRVEASYQGIKDCEKKSDGGFFCDDPVCKKIAN